MNLSLPPACYESFSPSTTSTNPASPNPHRLNSKEHSCWLRRVRWVLITSMHSCNTKNPILISIFRPLLPWRPRLDVIAVYYICTPCTSICQKKTKKSMILSRVHVLLLMLPLFLHSIHEGGTRSYPKRRKSFVWRAVRAAGKAYIFRMHLYRDQLWYQL